MMLDPPQAFAIAAFFPVSPALLFVAVRFRPRGAFEFTANRLSQLAKQIYFRERPD